MSFQIVLLDGGSRRANFWTWSALPFASPAAAPFWPVAFAIEDARRKVHKNLSRRAARTLRPSKCA